MPIDYSHQHLSSSVMEEGSPHTPISTGGSSIDATDKQIVFMDGDTAVGSPNLTWKEGSRSLRLDASVNGTAEVTALGAGTQIFLRGADGDNGLSAPTGGEVTLLTGNGSAGNSGDLSLLTGAADTVGDSGAVFIKTGRSVEGASGDIDIRTNADGPEGGSINLVAGTGNDGDGGNVLLQAGNSVGGSHGSIQMYTFGNLVELDSTGLYIGALAVFIQGLPTSDPGVAGQLWNSSNTLKISAG